MKASLKKKYEQVEVGAWADTLVEFLGIPHDVNVLGKDKDGLVIEWMYPGIKFTLAMAEVTTYNVKVYAVQKIEWLPEPKKETVDAEKS